jgi:hypothetical protein
MPLEERIRLHNTDPKQRIGTVERGELLRRGLAWIDAAGVLHPEQPDFHDFPEIFPMVESTPTVRAALLAANEAAREVGRLLVLLEQAQAKAAETHAAAKVAAAAEWSRINAAPHDAEHNSRVREYFDRPR